MPRCVPGVARVQDEFSPARAQIFEFLAAAEAPDAQTIIPPDSSIGPYHRRLVPFCTDDRHRVALSIDDEGNGGTEIYNNYRGRMAETITKAYQDWKVH